MELSLKSVLLAPIAIPAIPGTGAIPCSAPIRRAAIALLVIAALPALALPAFAQSDRPVAIGHLDGRTYYLHEAKIHAVDHDTREWSMIDVPAVDTLFHPNGRPAWYSSAIDRATRTIWIWDRSVGATLMINLDDPTDKRPVWRRSSHVQFEHAGGLDPRTGRPLAFSGYGYYRAKEFILTYDPELETWAELPTTVSGADRTDDDGITAGRPEPRMNAVMATSFSDSLIAVIGGTIDVGAGTTPFYSQPAGDAWLLDLESGGWTRIPFAPWMECHLQYTAEQIGQLPGSRAAGTIHFWVSELCPIDPAREHLRNKVLEWQPLEGRYRVLAAFERAPEPQKLTMVDAAAAADPGDSIRVGFLNRTADADMFGADIIVMTAPVELSSEWTRLPALPSERRARVWLWILGGVLLVGAAIAGTITASRRKLAAVVYPTQERLEIAQGRTHTSTILQPHVRLLLEGLAAARNGNDLIDPDALLDVFEERYSDLESARAMRNKAYNEANELAENIAGRPLIERIQREDDRRRYMYRLLMPVRVR